MLKQDLKDFLSFAGMNLLIWLVLFIVVVGCVSLRKEPKKHIHVCSEPKAHITQKEQILAKIDWYRMRYDGDESKIRLLTELYRDISVDIHDECIHMDGTNQ